MFFSRFKRDSDLFQQLFVVQLYNYTGCKEMNYKKMRHIITEYSVYTLYTK
jgi:hypothetical protein